MVGRLLLCVTHLPSLLQLILTRGLGDLGGALHINDVTSSWDHIKKCVWGGPHTLTNCLWCQGRHLYFPVFTPHKPQRRNHIEQVFNVSCFLTFLPFQNPILENNTPRFAVLVFTVKWSLSTPCNTATAERFLSSPWGHDLNIKKTFCSLSFCFRFFFPCIFRGEWKLEEWPWNWMHAPNVIKKHEAATAAHCWAHADIKKGAGYLQYSTNLHHLSSVFLLCKVLF